MMAHHSSIYATTKCSPAKLMLGRELRPPVDLLLGRPAQEEPDVVTPYADNLQQMLETVHKFARSNLKLSSERSKMYYNTKSSDNTTPVWLSNPKKKKGVSPKLSRNWEGPYIVMKPIYDLVYRIQLGTTTKPKVVHWNRLWCYNSDNPLEWLELHTTQTKPMETPMSQNLEPEMVNQDVEPKEQDDLVESMEDRELWHSTRTRKPQTCYNPANTRFSLMGHE